jgi:hypothetical protein
VPAHDGLRANEKRTPALAGQDAACCSQKRAVPHPVDRAPDLTAKDRDLVTKDKILEADLLGGAILGGKDGERPTRQQVEE